MLNGAVVDANNETCLKSMAIKSLPAAVMPSGAQNCCVFMWGVGIRYAEENASTHAAVK